MNILTKYAFLLITLLALAIAILIASLTSIKLSNEQYDRLKKLVLKWAGIMTFLGVIVSVFNPPFGSETLTLVAGIGAFLAYMLGVSNKNYSGGAAMNPEDLTDRISDDYYIVKLDFDFDTNEDGDIDDQEQNDIQTV